MGNLILSLLLIGTAAALVIAIVRAMHVEQEGKIAVIETFGRFSRIAWPGRFFLWPWDSVRVDLPLQVFTCEIPNQKLITSSGVPISLSMVVFYQLAHAQRPLTADARVLGVAPAPRGTNLVTVPAPVGAGRPGEAQGILFRSGPSATAVAPSARLPRATLLREPGMVSRMLGRRDWHELEVAAYLAVYTVEDWRKLTEREANDTLHRTFGELDFSKEVFGHPRWQSEVAERVANRLNDRTTRWGVEIHEVTFQGVTFSEFTMQNLTAEARAERENRIRLAEAKNQKDIAAMLGLDANAILQWRYIDAMRDLAKTAGARILLNSNMVPALGGGGGGSGGGGPLMIPEDQPAPQNPNPVAALTFPPANPQLMPPADFTPLPSGSAAGDQRRD